MADVCSFAQQCQILMFNVLSSLKIGNAFYVRPQTVWQLSFFKDPIIEYPFSLDYKASAIIKFLGQNRLKRISSNWSLQFYSLKVFEF